MIKLLTAAALTAALCLAAGAASAGECEDMTKSVKTLIDKLDPNNTRNQPARCAAFSEGLGLMKVFRMVTDECLPEGDKRFSTLAGLDRSIRNLQGEIDRMCH